MPKMAGKTPNFAFFHLFLVYFFPQTGPRPIFGRSYFEVYTSPASSSKKQQGTAKNSKKQYDTTKSSKKQ